MTNKEENLELRMFSLVLYQLSGAQAAIQKLHSTVEYFIRASDEGKELWMDWATNHKTVMMMNGGSSSLLLDKMQYIEGLGFECVPFYEPDLYNQMTSFSIIVSERVFNERKYLQHDITPEENSLRGLLKKLHFHGGR